MCYQKKYLEASFALQNSYWHIVHIAQNATEIAHYPLKTFVDTLAT